MPSDIGGFLFIKRNKTKAAKAHNFAIKLLSSTKKTPRFSSPKNTAIPCIFLQNLPLIPHFLPSYFSITHAISSISSPPFLTFSRKTNKNNKKSQSFFQKALDISQE